MWKTVEDWPLPTYPEDARRDGVVGVAVTVVLVGRDGRVSRATVLEAPDERIANATLDAIRRWTFKPLLLEGVDGAMPVSGRITLYFCRDGSGGKVMTVEERARSRRQGDSSLVCDANRTHQAGRSH